MVLETHLHGVGRHFSWDTAHILHCEVVRRSGRVNKIVSTSHIDGVRECCPARRIGLTLGHRGWVFPGNVQVRRLGEEINEDLFALKIDIYKE